MSNILTFFWYGVGIYVLPFLFALSVAHATFKIIDCASKAETRTGRIGLSFFAALVVGFSVWVINGVQGGPLGPDVEGALFRPIAPVPALGALILLAGGFFALALGRLSLWRLVVAGGVIGAGVTGLHLVDVSAPFISHMFQAVIAGDIFLWDIFLLPAFGVGLLAAVALNRGLFPSSVGGKERLYSAGGMVLFALGILFSPYAFTLQPQILHDILNGVIVTPTVTVDFLGYAGEIAAATFIVIMGSSLARRIHADQYAEKARFGALAHRSSNGILVVRDGKIHFINPFARTLLAIGDGINVSDAPIRNFLHPDYISLFEKNSDALSDLAECSERIPIIMRNRKGKDVETSMSVARIKSAEHTDFVLELLDTSKQKQSAIQLVSREQRLRAIMDNVADGIIITDLNGVISSVNAAAVRVFRCSADKMVGMALSSFLRDDIDVTATGRHEITAKRHDGILFFLDITISEMTVGMQKSLIATVRDITDRKQAESQTLHFANYDLVTNLPNRMKLQALIGDAIKKDTIGSVFYIGVDRIRSVVDSLGHDIGDQLLQAIAARLQQGIGPAGMVGVWNPGEYVIIVPGMTKRFEIECLVASLVKETARPFTIGGHEIIVGATAGAATFPKDGLAAYHLVRNAAMAQNAAQNRGESSDSGFCFFSSEMLDAAAERHRMESDLRHAIEKNELKVFYQPKMDMASGDVSGMEALLRWDHGELGLVSPAQFIPLAEETGLIVPIGAWVLEEACRQTMVWQKAGYENLRIAVNLSGRQFDDAGLLDTILGALVKTGLSPNDLELEVTESSLIRDIDAGLHILESIRKMGISIAIDDFGTGYSSLGHLKFMPLDTLKIDQSFIRHVPDDEDGAVIVSTIATMARNLGFKVVAEGIESIEQEAFLKDLDCDMGQGFYYSRPLEAGAFYDFLKEKAQPSQRKSRAEGEGRPALTLLSPLSAPPKKPFVSSSLRSLPSQPGTTSFRRDTQEAARPRQPLPLR